VAGHVITRALPSDGRSGDIHVLKGSIQMTSGSGRCQEIRHNIKIYNTSPEDKVHDQGRN